MKDPRIVLTVAEQVELLAFIKAQYLNPNVYPRISALYDKLARVQSERQVPA